MESWDSSDDMVDGWDILGDEVDDDDNDSDDVEDDDQLMIWVTAIRMMRATRDVSNQHFHYCFVLDAFTAPGRREATARGIQAISPYCNPQ